MSTYLTRKQAAEFIRERICCGSVALLAKLAREGTGPHFYVAGKSSLYAPDELQAWCESRLELRGDKPSRRAKPVVLMALPVSDIPLSPSVEVEPSLDCDVIAQGLRLAALLGAAP